MGIITVRVVSRKAVFNGHFSFFFFVAGGLFPSPEGFPSFSTRRWCIPFAFDFCQFDTDCSVLSAVSVSLPARTQGPLGAVFPFFLDYVPFQAKPPERFGTVFFRFSTWQVFLLGADKRKRCASRSVSWRFLFFVHCAVLGISSPL